MAAPIDTVAPTGISFDSVIPAFDSGSFLFKFVDADAWNRYFPYQFMLLHEEDSGDFTVTPWRYTLPISPQSLSISMLVADKVEPTLTGYNFTSGGAPFRIITIQGTTGMIPEDPSIGGSRGSVVSSSDVTGPLARLSAILQPIANAASQLISGSPPRVKNEHTSLSFPDLATGFWRFHELKTFLESYLGLSRRSDDIKSGTSDDAGETLQLPHTLHPDRIRLAFCIWKDESVYICKLTNFEWRRDVSSPMEYTYNIQLQAYRRVKLNLRGRSFTDFKFPLPKASVLSQIISRVQAVRNLVSAAANLAKLGIAGPLSIISEISRQFSGLVKDIVGINRTIADLPQALVVGILNSAIEAVQAVNNAATDIPQAWRQLGDSFSVAVQNKLSALALATSPPTSAKISATGGATFALQTNNQPAIGGSGNSGSDFNRPDVSGQHPMNKAHYDPDKLLADVPELANVDVTKLPLTKDQKAQLDAEVAKSADVSVSDIETMKTQVVNNLDLFSAAIGSWDPVYNATYGLPTPTVPQSVPTREELDIIFAINEFVQSMDYFIGYLRDLGGIQNNRPQITSMEYIAGLAQKSGITFSVPLSKYAVPFPYGASLERLALQYLGDPNRWHEIAALNNLRSPYIDEVGFELPLLVNGNGNQVIVSSRDNLFIGQVVYLSSSGQRRETHRILGIAPNDPQSFVLTLDGDLTLGRFLTNQQAVLNAFLPGTVNSRQIIYIPSNDTPTIDDHIPQIPGIDPYDPLLRLGGIDLLLGSDFDLVVTPAGDNPLAFGLTSLIQSAKVAFKTEKGSLLQHSEWGFGGRIGQSSADFNAQSLIQDLKTFFDGDPTLAGLKSVHILYQTNSLLIDAQLGVRGLNRSFPVLLELDARR